MLVFFFATWIRLPGRNRAPKIHCTLQNMKVAAFPPDETPHALSLLSVDTKENTLPVRIFGTGFVFIDNRCRGFPSKVGAGGLLCLVSAGISLSFFA